MDMMKGSDPPRMAKGESHMTMPEEMATKDQDMMKPASVKPGMGKNMYSKGMDSMPGFQGMESYKSASRAGDTFGQGTYPPASKQLQPSIGSK